MSTRRILTALAFLTLIVLLVGQVRQFLADPTFWPPDDYIEYWAAAQLNFNGENPYDRTLLQPLQVANGRDTKDGVMMWNPPWTLAVVFPLGLIPSREGQLLWLAFNILVVVFCGDRLWRFYGGSAEKRWIGWMIAGCTLPCIFALQTGQIGPILLLGAVLFLEFERRGWHYAAGAATVLLAIKPHLAYLIWVAILCRALTENRWKVIIGGAAMGLICSLVPLLTNPEVWHQYFDALANRPPVEWRTPTFGVVLRLAFGLEHFKLQFIPVLFGLAWFAIYYARQSKRWSWDEQVPLLLAVSFLTAPYGAWPFDMPLLLPAAMYLVLKGEASTRRVVFAGLIALNLACVVGNIFKINMFWYILFTPALLLLYRIGTRPSSVPDATQLPDPRAVPA